MADNPSNIVPDNLIVIEGGKQLVPAPAPSDAGKVLGVVNASGDIGWVEDQGGTLTQVQADWAETDPSKVSFIDNKPTIPSKTSDLQNDSGFITSSDIPAIPTKTSDLQNDSGFITSSDVPTKTSELQNDSGFITSADVPAQVQANWNETSTGAASYIQNKPSIPSKTSDLQNDSGFITSSDIPSIPTKTSDLQNDSGFITSADIPAQVQSDWNETNTSSAAYIQNKPTIPPGVIVDQTYNASSTNAQSGVAVAEALSTIPVAPTYSEGDGIDITNNVISADVDGTTIGIDSTTHKIKSLQTIPTKTSDLQNDSGFITSSALPTVNDATLTIQKNGSTVDTFTANSSTNKTVNIAVPTKTSDLQNDSGFITSADIPAQVQANWNESNSSSAAYIQNKPTIPTVDHTYNASSTNAQSGVAVASAVAGVNAVPASTSADEDKVLTVNSSGTPVWAAAQGGGGGGSGGDSEFPYDPGYLDYGADKMVVRFGDISYDPTTAASASRFVSITALSEPGVYEYELIQSRNTLYWSFADEWNSFSTNPVDVLYYHCSDGDTQYYRGLFQGCTGLRSVWNFRGTYFNLDNWCSGCTNLQIFSSNSKDKYDAEVASGSLYISIESYFIKLGGTSTASNMFYDCASLRRVDTLLYFDGASGGSAYNICYELKSLEVGPAIGGCLMTLGYAFSNCKKLIRLFNAEDFPALALMYPVIYSAPTVAASMANAFDNCYSLQDVSGLKLSNCVVSDLSEAFKYCHGLPELNCSLYLRSSGCNASRAFQGCLSLRTTPCIDYKAITDASLMFYDNSSLLDVTGLDGLAHQCTNVNYMLYGAYNVIKGVDTLYSALSSSQTIASHDGTFDNTGAYAWNNQLSQIPSSWGGTGA